MLVNGRLVLLPIEELKEVYKVRDVRNYLTNYGDQYSFIVNQEVKFQGWFLIQRLIYFGF